MPSLKFDRNLIISLFGTFIASIVPLLITPLLSRIYSSSDYGVYNYFLSITNLMVIFFAGRFEYAILLPKDNRESISLVKLSITIASFMLLFVTLVFSFLSLFSIEVFTVLPKSMLFLIPLASFILTINQTLLFWLNRKADFKNISINKVLNAILVGVLSLLLFHVTLHSTSLIWALVIGQFLCTLVLVYKISGDFNLTSINISSLKAVSLKYINFPKFNIMSGIIETTALQLPVFLISHFYGSSELGQYSMAQRIILIPISFIIASVGPVFRQKAAASLHEKGNCLEVYKQFFFWLFVCGVFIFSVLYIGVDLYMAKFLGPNWGNAEVFSKIIIFSVFVRFISNPLSSVIVLKEKQKLDLCLQIGLILLTSIAFYLGYYLHQDIKFSILYFVLVYLFKYVAELFISFKLSK